MSECAAERRRIWACCEAPLAAKFREAAETFVPSAVPAGIASGCSSSARSNLKVVRAMPRSAKDWPWLWRIWPTIVTKR